MVWTSALCKHRHDVQDHLPAASVAALLRDHPTLAPIAIPEVPRGACDTAAHPPKPSNIPQVEDQVTIPRGYIEYLENLLAQHTAAAGGVAAGAAAPVAGPPAAAAAAAAAAAGGTAHTYNSPMYVGMPALHQKEGPVSTDQEMSLAAGVFGGS